MGIWDDIANTFEDDIKDAVSDIALLTPLSHVEISAMSDAEKAELAAALKEVQGAIDGHEKIQRFATRSGAFFKLVKRLGVVL